MDRRTFLFNASALGLSSACTTAPEFNSVNEPYCRPSALVVANVLAWDGETFVEDAEIIVSEGRIEGLTRAGRSHRPRGARVIDGSGATLLPGLIDTHTHFFDLGAALPVDSVRQAAERAFPATGPATLASGVTTARVHFFDSEFGPALARAAEANCLAAPRLKLGGPALLGGAATLNARSVRGVASVEDAIAKVRQSRATGATWLSLMEVQKFSG